MIPSILNNDEIKSSTGNNGNINEQQKNSKIQFQSPNLNFGSARKQKTVKSIKIIQVNRSNEQNINKNQNNIEYRGLKNLGATCYMNSILQVLFHLPLFRRYIFSIKVPHKDEEHNIVLHLQRIFALMQLSKYPVSTRSLARSFGWSNTETMEQQDIQEFGRVFLDKLESTINKINAQENIDKPRFQIPLGYPLNQIINFTTTSLFKGKYVSIFKCRNVNYSTYHLNEFLDLPLHVRGISSLGDSLKLFTSSSPLEGKYDAGPYGKQDADVYYRFVELPPVLQLHLRRFDIDPDTQRNVKIDTFFSYPKIIDLKSSLIDDSEREKLNNYENSNSDNKNSSLVNINNITNNQINTKYELYAVLVHAGNIISGHYTAYIKPGPKCPWHYFNDSEVRMVSEDLAFDNNFGGPDPSQTGKNKSHCAYILIYIRMDAVSSIYCNVSNSEINEELTTYTQEVDTITSKKKQKKEQENQQIQACIVQVSDLEFLADRTGRILFESKRTIQLERTMSFENAYNFIAVYLDVHPVFLTIWVIHQNMLKMKLNRTSTDSTLEDIMQYAMDKNSLKLFVEVDEEQESLNSSKMHAHGKNYISNQKSFQQENENKNKDSEIVVFIFAYFPSFSHPFKFVSTVSVQFTEKVSDLFDSVRESFNIPRSVNIRSYLILDTNNYIPPREINHCEQCIGSSGIQNGSIVVLVPDPEKFHPSDDEDHSPEPTKNDCEVSKEDFAYSYIPDYITAPPQNFEIYFRYLYNNRYIVTRQINDPDSHIYIRFPDFISISEFKRFVAFAYELEYNEIQDVMCLYTKNSSLPIFSNNEETDIISSLIPPDTYEIMICLFKQCSIESILPLRRLIIHNLTNEGIKCTNFGFYFQNDTISQIMKEFITGTKTIRSFRILQYNGNKISMPLPLNTYISNLSNPIRIENIPKDQVDIPRSSFLVQAFQVKPGTTNPIDKFAPFLICINDTDKFYDVRKKMKKYLNARKVKESKSRYFVRINEKTVDLNNDYKMKTLRNSGSPIYIEYNKRTSQQSHTNGVKIYT